MARRTALVLALALVACAKEPEPTPATAAPAPVAEPAAPATEEVPVAAPVAEPADEGTTALPGAPPAVGKLAAPPDIVLITLDTLRREHLGCYGYFRDTSPRIDALAREGLVFERALAAMASTLPSHLTILTGLYPHQHGVSSNLRGAAAPFTSMPGRRSVAEVLAEEGYRTAAFVSAAPLSLATGVKTGFQTFKPSTGMQRRASETNDQVLGWLSREASSPGPLFMWVHYFDPHEPCDPLPPYHKKFKTDDQQREWIRARGIDPEALERRYGDSDRVRRHFLTSGLSKRGDGPHQKPHFTLDRVADLMNRYDGEVSYMDRQIGVLFDALRHHGRWDDAIVIVVADHGQSLGENVWLGHGTITNINTFVPLIVRLPASLGVAPGRVVPLVSLADLMPTVFARFDLSGGEALRTQFEGVDVLSGAFGRDGVMTELTSDDLGDGEKGRQYAFLSGQWKYVHRPSGTDVLYDLAGAGEFVDVMSAHPDVAARLRAETLTLLERKRATPSDANAPLDPELQKQLEELGYGGEDDGEDAAEDAKDE